VRIGRRIKNIGAKSYEERQLHGIAGAENVDRHVWSAQTPGIGNGLGCEQQVMVAVEKRHQTAQGQVFHLQLEQSFHGAQPQFSESSSLLHTGQGTAVAQGLSFGGSFHGACKLLAGYGATVAGRRDQVEGTGDVCADPLLERHNFTVRQEQRPVEPLKRTGIGHHQTVEPKVVVQLVFRGEPVPHISLFVQKKRVDNTPAHAEFNFHLGQ